MTPAAEVGEINARGKKQNSQVERLDAKREKRANVIAGEGLVYILSSTQRQNECPTSTIQLGLGVICEESDSKKNKEIQPITHRIANPVYYRSLLYPRSLGRTRSPPRQIPSYLPMDASKFLNAWAGRSYLRPLPENAQS
ncbi:unnamed protein product, partial [Ectocarpus sp. 8 AP-2014]